MKRTFVLLAMLVAGSAGAEGFPCSEPQYAFLKDATQDELKYEFCRATRQGLSNRNSFQSTEQMIAEKKSLNVYSPEDREKQKLELKAAHSCEAAARSISATLARRFKTSPRGSCA